MYEKYNRYKDSGVEWLGMVPEHWNIEPGLKFIYESKERNIGMKRSTVLSLSYGNIRVRDKSELTGLVPESFETYQLVKKGDVIFRPTDLQNDKVSLRSSISNFEGIITSAYLNLRFKETANSKFYHYLFRTIDNNKVIYGLGSGLRQNIDFRDFRRFSFPIPPLTEQTAIANFLDKKTSQIDHAIELEEKTIALLKEHKQILIQELVTGKKVWDKAQNCWTKPAEVKYSGVEWIGEIPKNWEIKKLKYIFDIKNGQDYKHVLSKRGYPVIGSGGQFAYASNYLHDGEAVLLGRKGTIDKPMYVNERFWTVDTMFYAIVYKNFSAKYIYYVSTTIPFKLYSTSTALPSMTQNDLNNHIVAVPPLEEQNDIVHHIEQQSAKIDRAIALQEQKIEKLKELKATLIDSAVTGKIKVSKV